MSAPPSAEFIFASAARQQITKYVDVASLALLVVDYFGTLESEITHMWTAERSLAKFLYFMTRYLAFIDVSLGIYYHTTLGLKPSTCRTLFSIESVSLLVGVAFAEAILFLRVLALSGRNKKMMIWLVFQYTGVLIAQAAIYSYFLKRLEFTVSPLPTVLGCVPLPPKSNKINVMLSALFGLILGNELSVLLMTFVIGLLKYRSLRSPLIKIFYRDGFFYFFMLSAISAGNITADLVGPPEFRFLLVILQRVMHTILATRMLLHMRDYANTTTAQGSGIGLSHGPTLPAPQFKAFGDKRPSQTETWDSYYHDPGTTYTEDIPITNLRPNRKREPDDDLNHSF